MRAIVGDDEEGGIAEGYDNVLLLELTHPVEAADTRYRHREILTAAAALEHVRVIGKILVGEVELHLESLLNNLVFPKNQ